MSTHYRNLAASTTAACDACGGPARPEPASRYQAYRRPDGWLFLCLACCTPERHAAYRSTSIYQREPGGSCRYPRKFIK